MKTQATFSEADWTRGRKAEYWVHQIHPSLIWNNDGADAYGPDFTIANTDVYFDIQHHLGGYHIAIPRRKIDNHIIVNGRYVYTNEKDLSRTYIVATNAGTVMPLSQTYLRDANNDAVIYWVCRASKIKRMLWIDCPIARDNGEEIYQCHRDDFFTMTNRMMEKFIKRIQFVEKKNEK